MADGHLGQGGHGLGHLGEIPQAGQVARDEARHHPGAQAAQARLQAGFVRRFGGEKVAHGLCGPRGLQAVAQFFADLRAAFDQTGQETAQGQGAVEPGGVVGRGGHSGVI